MSARLDLDPVVLGLRQIYIIPNWRGLGWLGFIVLLGLMAFVYNNNLIYGLCFLLFSLFLVSAVHGVQSLLGLECSFATSQPVFAGDQARFNLNLHNPGRHARWGVRVQFREQHDSLQVVDLAPGQTRKLELAITATRRGWLVSPRLELGSRYPFGWYTIWSLPRVQHQVLVYPALAKAGTPFPDDSGGDAASGQSRRVGEEFFGAKPYQAGDSLRQIYWRALAKGQDLQSKLYAGTHAHELWLDYTQTPGSDIEQRLSQLCRWVLEAEQLGWRYGLRLPGAVVPLDNGTNHCSQCLTRLALFYEE